MSETSRNAPCPCGSGIKYKKCCLVPDETLRLTNKSGVVLSGGSRIRSSGLSSHSLDGASWPVERVWVPIRDVWCATGWGTVAVVRRCPDGRRAYAGFLLELTDHGLTGAFGNVDQGLDHDPFAGLRDEIPPMEEGSLEDASAYVYGAAELAAAKGGGLPPDQLARFLDLLPPPPGGPPQWLEGLVGPGGLTPPALLRIIADLPRACVGDKQEIAVATAMTFLRPGMSASSPRQSTKFPPVTEEGGSTWFRYTPIPSWKQSPDGRSGKVQGEVRVEGDHIVATAFSLSMAARLIADLHVWLGRGLRLTSTHWGNTFSGREETSTFEAPTLVEGPTTPQTEQAPT